MKNFQVNLRILIIATAVFGKLECSPLMRTSGNSQKISSERSLWSELLLSEIGSEETSAEPRLQLSGITTTRDLISKPTTISPGKALQLNAVDSIEDAILAALETIKEQEQITTSTTTLASVPPPPASNQAILDIESLLQELNTITETPGVSHGQNVVVGEKQRPIPAFFGETTTPEVPGEYIAGIFGSLGQANLAGILENSFKLAGSNAVQSFLTGITDTLTCQITPGCTLKRP